LGPGLPPAVLILVWGVFVGGWLSRWVMQFLGHRDLGPPLRLLLSRIAWGCCFAVFVLMALQNLGVELLPLLAGLGVAGAGIALATHDLLSNIVSVLTFNFCKPFLL